MTTYLHTSTFNVYFSGVYTGKIHFTEQQIMLAKVDPRRRTQMQDNVLDGQFKTVLPLQKSTNIWMLMLKQNGQKTR